MKIKQAKLLGGPHDGVFTATSHGSASHEGEFYCHIEGIGDPDDVLRHAKTYLELSTPEGVSGVQAERVKVEKWMAQSVEHMKEKGFPLPTSMLMPIPMSRIGAHWNMLRSGF